MKLSASASKQFLARPNPNVFIALIYGNDTGQVSEQVTGLRKTWLGKQADDFSINIFSTGDLKSNRVCLVDEMAAYSLSGGPRLIHFKNPAVDECKEIIETLKFFDGNTNKPVARLIIEAGSLSPANSLRKTLENEKQRAVVIACYPDRLGDVIHICKKILLDAGHNIEKDALDLLVASVPPDRRILHLELEKLICFVTDKPNDVISRADIQAIIAQAGDSTLEKLVFACIEGRTNDADQILGRAIEAGQAPIMIVRAIARHLNRMHQVLARASRGGSLSGAMAQLKPPVFAMHQAAFSQHCSTWSQAKIEQALENALITEQELKSPLGAQTHLIGRFILAVSSLRR